MTSYSPCFRKEGGAHGLEERGLYRVRQFEKQEMIVLCKAEEAMDSYKLDSIVNELVYKPVKEIEDSYL